MQWAEANHKGTHGRQAYETLCIAVGDWRRKEDDGRVDWLKNRLCIGTMAMKGGCDRRKVLDGSLFLKGYIFNDGRSDFKTKHQKFPAEALLCYNFSTRSMHANMQSCNMLT